MTNLNAQMRASLAPHIASIETDTSAVSGALPRALSIKALCQLVFDRAACRASPAHSLPGECAGSPQIESAAAHCPPPLVTRYLNVDGLAHWIREERLTLVLRDDLLIFTGRDGKSLGGAQPSAVPRKHIEAHRTAIVEQLTPLKE